MQSAYERSRDFRSKIIELAEEGGVNWETIARTFIVQCSQDENESVFDELTS